MSDTDTFWTRAQQQTLWATVASLADVDSGTLSATTRLDAIGLHASIKRAALTAAIREAFGVACPRAAVATTLEQLERAVAEAITTSQHAVAGNATEVTEKTAWLQRAEAMANAVARDGCGVDIEEVTNLPEARDYRIEPFYCDHFTDSEIAWCTLQEHPLQHFAARWSAKEALKKCDPALMAIPMNRIEVAKRIDGSVYARCRVGDTWRTLSHALSLSHTDTQAVAMAVGRCDATTVAMLNATIACDRAAMPQSFSAESIEAACAALGIGPGDTMFLHSDITLAMSLSGEADIESACRYLLDAIRRVLGPTGTLIVPTFNYDFCRGVPYDDRHTPSQVGVFTEYVRTHADAVRTFHPIYSCAVIGPAAAQLCESPSRSAFGKGSLFDRLRTLRCKLVFFNVGFDACTYVHYIEQQANVDYRFLKYFTGTISRSGETWLDTFDFFVRRDDADVTNEFGRLADRMVQQRRLCACAVGDGRMLAATCEDVYDESMRLLSEDRYALLKSPPKHQPATTDIVARATGAAETTSMKGIVEALYPLDRTMASAGMDQALETLATFLPARCSYRIERFASTHPAWTWRTLERYTVHDAYIEDPTGRRIADVQNHRLHLVSYSPTIDRWMAWDELSPHLHVAKTRPDALPWRFNYYERNWGFCVTQRTYDAMDRACRYHVVIRSQFDTSPMPGLAVGVIDIDPPNRSTPMGRMMLCAHLCHPMQANDDLAGVAVIVEVIRRLAKCPLPDNAMTLRVLLCPETNGSISYFANHPGLATETHGAVFCEMLGNANTLAMQHSRQGDAVIDRISERSLRERIGPAARFGNFREIIGNDEMVINGPGVNIPCISLTRYPYDEYHTSDDTPAIIHDAALAEAADIVEAIVRQFCCDYRPRRRFTGPVFLSGVGLWIDHAVNRPLNRAMEKIMLSLEGDRSISDIAAELQMDFWTVRDYLEQFRIKGLIDACPLA